MAGIPLSYSPSRDGRSSNALWGEGCGEGRAERGFAYCKSPHPARPKPSSGAEARRETGVLPNALWRHLLPEGEGRGASRWRRPLPDCVELGRDVVRQLEAGRGQVLAQML
jgi:hypothetical protein